MHTISKRALATLAVTFLTVAGASAASRTQRFELSHALAAGQAVAVDTASFDVAVKIGGADLSVVAEVKVKGSDEKLDSLLEKYRPRIIEKDGVLVVKATPERSALSLFGTHGDRVSGRLEITLPRDHDLSIDTASGDMKLDGDLGDARLDVDVASGNVEIDGAAKTISVDAASGDTTIRALRRVAKVEIDAASGDATVHGPVGRLDVDTASGDIQAHGQIDELEAAAASGDVVADGLTGSASIDTTSGDVELTFASMGSGARIHVDSTSGDVTLRVPGDVRYEGKLGTSSGGIESDLAGERGRRGRSYTLAGPGDVKLDVSTTSGSIRVVKAQ